MQGIPGQVFSILILATLHARAEARPLLFPHLFLIRPIKRKGWPVETNIGNRKDEKNYNNEFTNRNNNDNIITEKYFYHRNMATIITDKIHDIAIKHIFEILFITDIISIVFLLLHSANAFCLELDAVLFPFIGASLRKA